MTTTEKLEKIFTADFLKENASVDSLDALYAKVCEVDASVTKAELEEFLCAVSDEMHKQELTTEDLDNVAGGIGLLAIAGGIATVAGVFTATYAVGTAIGKFAYNLRH